MVFVKKSQGEIFGVALLFVVIIVAIIIFGQIKIFSPQDMGEKSQKSEKYQEVAAGTLDSILSMSSGCEVERGKDTIYDLIEFCENNYDTTDPVISCVDESTEFGACEKTIKVLNNTLFTLFNNTNKDKGVGQMPFKLIISTDDTSLVQKKLVGNLTNFGTFKYKINGNVETITELNYAKLGYNRAPSGLSTKNTAKRNINIELWLYFRD